MKLFANFASLVIFVFAKSFPRDFKYNALKKAYVNISLSLPKQNYLLSLVIGSNSSEKINSAIIASTTTTPHVVAKFDSKMEKFSLNSSAIVSLDSIESLEKFNQRTILPVTFSMKQQLIIYCRDGTYDQIDKIKTSRIHRPIVQYEYFVIEEEKSIRLLTFVWFTQPFCRRA